jgi:glucose/arabinose dehydrogenase
MRSRWLCAVLTLVVGSIANADEVVTPDAVRAELVVDDLDHPVQITSAPGEPERLYVVERGGEVRIVQNKKVLSEELLDISSVVRKNHPHGLLGIAFAPDFATSGQFYAAYVDPQGDINVGRFFRNKESAPDEDSMTVVIKLAQAFPNTHGAAIGFGKDGYLYVTWGDGGGPAENLEVTQRLDSLFGKVLRLDVSKAGKYSVPSDNPFLNQTKALKEIWALGLRNPRHLSFDRKQGDLLVVDEGERLTEVNIIERGKNYGGKVVDGSECAANPCSLTNTSPPLFTANATRSVIGGVIYRGSRFTELEGAYIFADGVSGEVFASIATGATRTTRLIMQLTKNQISAIGEDADGELYIGTPSGELLTLVKPPAGPQHPLQR